MHQKQPGTCEGVSHSVTSSSSFCVEVCRDISYFRDSSTQNGLYWDWGVCTETPKGSTRDCLGVSSSYVVCTRLKLNIEEAAETVWGSTLTYWSTSTINFQEEWERILLVYLLTYLVVRCKNDKSLKRPTWSHKAISVWWREKNVPILPKFLYS